MLALMSGENIFCIVPVKTKTQAVLNTTKGVIEEACSASILRNHGNATLYVDSDSGSIIL